MSEQKEVTFGQGRELFRQGEKGGELYFIKQGKVELTVRNEDTGESAVIATVGDRAVLGTMTFLEGEKRSATAKAITEVRAVVVNQAQREKLLKTIPQWFQVLVKDMSSNLRRLNQEFARLNAEKSVLEKRIVALQKRLGDDDEEEQEEEKPPATKAAAEQAPAADEPEGDDE